MDVLKIDVLSATLAEPARGVSAPHHMGRAQRSDELEQDDSQIALAGAESPSGNKRGEPAATTTEAYQVDATQSYNITTAVQKNDKESQNRNFENVLKRQLKQADGEQNAEDVSPKTQNSDTNGKVEQGLTLTALQNGITVLAEQKQSVTNDKTVSNQTPVLVGGDVAAVTENQEQVISGATQNQVKTTQTALLTPGQNAVVQQGKLAVAKEPSPNAETGQVHENTAAVSQQVTDNPVKMNAPADSDGSGKLSSQQELAPSKAQSAVVSAGMTIGLKDGKQVAVSAAIGGRQAGLEAAYRGRVKDGSGSERQKYSNGLSNGNDKVETGTTGLNEKLNVEKVELSSGKNDTTKSEQSIGVSQSARTQMSVFNVGQVTSDRPITVDGANVAARSASTNNTAAAIRDQIFQSVQTSIQQGQREITVHLNPPDLGRVSIKFSEQGKELTGLLEVTNSQTRAEIRQAIPEIIRSLEESGISIKRLEVTLSDLSGKSDLSRQSAQDSSRDNSSKDLWQQLGNQNFNDAGGNRFSYDSLVATGHFSGTPEFSGGILTGPNQSSRSDTLLDIFI